MKLRFSTMLIIALFSLNSLIAHHDLFENKNIVVLGGTGYLGRAITEEVLKYNPSSVTIFSRDEVKHFNCMKLFNDDLKLHMVIGDIRDYDAVLQVTKEADIVFHAAALKRMDALESNVQEAIKTNVLASLNVFNACVTNNVDKVLFVSTDKASSPINAYGACKFVSEKIFTNYDRRKVKTKFVVTRFGNILESTGSVIPIFIDKIQSGQDIPLTDARMSRFIICKREASQLMCDALRYGVGGEIVTKRLPALKVADLITVFKAHFNVDNKTHVIGLRPGEKLHEVLVNSFEMKRAYEYKNYLIVRPSVEKIVGGIVQEDPIYVQAGRYLGTEELGDYSSDQEVVTPENLLNLFKELSIL